MSRCFTNRNGLQAQHCAALWVQVSLCRVAAFSGLFGEAMNRHSGWQAPAVLMVTEENEVRQGAGEEERESRTKKWKTVIFPQSSKGKNKQSTIIPAVAFFFFFVIHFLIFFH